MTIVTFGKSLSFFQFYTLIGGMALISFMLLLWDLWLYRQPWIKSPRCPRCKYGLGDLITGARHKNQDADFAEMTCSDCGYIISKRQQAFWTYRSRTGIVLRSFLILVFLTPAFLTARYYWLNATHKRVEADFLKTGGHVEGDEFSLSYTQNGNPSIWWQHYLPRPIRLEVNSKVAVKINTNQYIPMPPLKRLKRPTQLYLKGYPSNAAALFKLHQIKRYDLQHSTFNLSHLNHLNHKAAIFFERSYFRGQCQTPYVTFLRVNSCDQVPFEKMNLPELKYLDVYGGFMPVETGDMKFPNLQRLHLNQVELKQPVNFSHMKSLKRVFIEFYKPRPYLIDFKSMSALEDLHTLALKASMPELTHIDQLDQVQVLVLYQWVTLSGVEGMSGLKSLHVPWGVLNHPEVKRLQKRRPDLEIAEPNGYSTLQWFYEGEGHSGRY